MYTLAKAKEYLDRLQGMKRIRNYKLYTDADYEALKTQPRANDFLAQFSGEPMTELEAAVA